MLTFHLNSINFLHLVFISTHNLATNPRLVKEIRLALDCKHEVSVLCFEFNDWSKPLNDAIYGRLKGLIHYYPLPGDRSDLTGWLTSSVLGMLSPMALKLFPGSVLFQSIYSNKRSWLLLRNLHLVKGTAGLVIAHNAGSFYPAMQFAKAHQIPYGIDLEDYHPGEGIGKVYAKHLVDLSRKVLPGAAYLTAASPLILSYTLKDLPSYAGMKSVVLNYFPGEEFVEPGEPEPGRLRLVWFSQQISHGRGLEQVVPLIVQHRDRLELHLYGNINTAFYNEWLIDRDNIIVHGALPQVELHAALAHCDVGLAIENNASNLNRALCLTNKLLSYFQAGLYIFCSSTPAQDQFISNYPTHGTVTELDGPALAAAFDALVGDAAIIRASRRERFVKARLNSWEVEGEKLKGCWEL